MQKEVQPMFHRRVEMHDSRTASVWKKIHGNNRKQTEVIASREGKNGKGNQVPEE